MSSLNQFLFGVYPYVCLAVFLVGSLLRFDRDQYTWKSDSSQLMRKDTLRWASPCFHAGILFLMFGHAVGLLTPHVVYEPFLAASAKQTIAIVAGGVAGTLCFVGLTALIVRRATDARVRAASHRSDMAVLVVLWLQLVLGLLTLPFSIGHSDGSVMLTLSAWAQGVFTLSPDAASIAALDWPYRAHLVLGMTLFLLFPFTRLVHVWSGLASVGYVLRPYQLVRSRRLNLPAGHLAGRRLASPPSRPAPVPVEVPAARPSTAPAAVPAGAAATVASHPAAPVSAKEAA